MTVPRRRFLFDLSLDDHALAAEAEAMPVVEEAPPPPPAFGEAELAAAREEGFAAGLEQGRASQLADDERRVSRAVMAACTSIETALAGLEEARADTLATTARACAAALRKMLPVVACRAPEEEILGLFRETIESLADEPRIVVRVADALLDPLGEPLKQAAARAGFPGRLIMIGEPAMSEADCRIEWADGGVGRDTTRLADAIAEAVERILITPLPAGTPSPDGAH